MVKLIASDLDGTIIDKNNCICEENYKAIKEINNKNIPFVVCTGKAYSIFKELCSSFNASYGIFGNGTSIIDLKTGEKIYENILDYSDIKKILEIAKKKKLHVHMYLDDDSVITEKLLYLDLRNYKLKEQYNNNALKFKIVSDVLEFINKHPSVKVTKIVISNTSSLKHIKSHILKNLKVKILTIRKYNKYKDAVIDKEYEYLDILPKDVNKDNALSFLCNYLNINKRDVLAIGDNLNDLAMVKSAGIGVAVNNSYWRLKHSADFITKAPVEKGAFAEAIHKFVEI